MEDEIVVVIEIPRGSRNKYEYDPDLDAIVLDRRLFTSMAYPADYGFIEGTLGEDGDPVLGLRDAIALLRAELERPKVKVKVDFEDLRPLNCKPQQLCSVFLELLRNATAHLQGEGEIHISSTEADDQITIQISDNGRGIDSERLPNLFEPSFAAKDGRVVTSNWACSAREL